MGRPREFDPDQVVRSAKDVFWRQGFEATSIDDLVERTGLGRSSIYQAFGSKRDLLDRALELYLEENLGWLLGQMDGAEPGLAALDRYFATTEENLRDPGHDTAMGCFMLGSVHELARRDERVAEQAAAYRRRTEEAFEHQLRAAVEAGEIDPGETDQRARLLIVLALGLNAYLRGNRDIDAAADAVGAIRRQIAGWRLGVGRRPQPRLGR